MGRTCLGIPDQLSFRSSSVKQGWRLWETFKVKKKNCGFEPPDIFLLWNNCNKRILKKSPCATNYLAGSAGAFFCLVYRLNFEILYILKSKCFQSRHMYKRYYKCIGLTCAGFNVSVITDGTGKYTYMRSTSSTVNILRPITLMIHFRILRHALCFKRTIFV